MFVVLLALVYSPIWRIQVNVSFFSTPPAIANLEIYFTKAIGIGEQSDLQEEIRKWTDVFSNSLDGLESLEASFKVDGLAK
jgi:hypothetical protein